MPTVRTLFLALLAAATLAGDAAAQLDSAAIARARADSIKRPWTAADAQFVTGMIPHHAQAILMSGWAFSNDASAEIRTLAGRITNAQQDEILIMRNWLLDRRQPLPDDEAAAGGHHHHHGPGMLSAEELARLQAARGEEFDRLFLQFMIRHHQGAVTMVQALFAQDGTGQDDTIFKLASDINVDQTTEINRMQRMLAARLFGTASR